MALNASVSQVGEQMGCLFRLSRVASSEAEFPHEPRPAEGSAEGVSSEVEIERTAGGLGEEASSEAEIVLRVRGGLGWAVPWNWAVG